MDTKVWSAPTTNSEAYRRAGGRRKINKERRVEAVFNSTLAMLLYDQGVTPAEIAEYFGCHLTTAYRYIWRFRGKLRPYQAMRKASKKAAIERAKARGWV